MTLLFSPYTVLWFVTPLFTHVTIGENCPFFRRYEPGLKEHAETTGHCVQSENAQILEKGVMNYKRFFLESFHSWNDNVSMNEHRHLPRV